MAQYKAGADENNKLAYVEMTIYSDSGFSFFEDTSSYAAHYAKVCGDFLNCISFCKNFKISWYDMYLYLGLLCLSFMGY